MAKVIVEATQRKVTGKQVGALRRQGKLPGIMYGHNFTTTPITMDLRSAGRTLSGLSSSTLVYITLDGSEHASLVREKQRDFIKGTLLHVDFQVVSLTEKIRAKVSVEITGVSPAVKDLNGVVVTGLDGLEVESLPQDLPERFFVDISHLVKIGDGFYVRDLPPVENVTVLTDPNEMLVIVTASAVSEEETTAEVAAAVSTEEPEVIEKGKKEEEAAEEPSKK